MTVMMELRRALKTQLALLERGVVFGAALVSVNLLNPPAYADTGGVTPELRHQFAREELPAFRVKLKSQSAAEELGKKLFEDKRFSRFGELSCQSCHLPEFGWVDGKRRSIENNSRRSMPLWNLAWDRSFTWSGRAGSIASQAVLAATAPPGMNADLGQYVHTVAADPRLAPEFKRAFGAPDRSGAMVSTDRIALALEAYVRTLVSPRNRFDQWVDSGRGLTTQERRGFAVFTGKGNCVTCHSGWRFTDGQLHDIGLDGDPGAGAWLPGGQFKFKTMGLRDVARRKFYMHNGALSSLREVIAYYNAGGFIQRSTNELKPLKLTQDETKDLVAFLEAL
jgi:cytochrome c peroxidase